MIEESPLINTLRLHCAPGGLKIHCESLFLDFVILVFLSLLLNKSFVHAYHSLAKHALLKLNIFSAALDTRDPELNKAQAVLKPPRNPCVRCVCAESINSDSPPASVSLLF